MALSKAEQAYQLLKKRIMDGTYGPGHHLVIDQLGRENNISSVPWRESLRRLEAEGWVDFSRNVGAVVKTFDTLAWEKTLRLLARLEGLATALSAPHLTDDDIAESRRINRSMEEAIERFDTSNFGSLNRRFHELLCSRCEDERLSELVLTEWARLELIRRSAFWYAPGRAQASVFEHDALLDLIEARADTETIENSAKRHEIRTLEAVKRHESQLPQSEHSR